MLQNLDELLLHVLRWLYGLDVDKHKNITSTTCYIQNIHTLPNDIQIDGQKREHADMLCIG